jgi:hypothetical protein
MALGLQIVDVRLVAVHRFAQMVDSLRVGERAAQEELEHSTACRDRSSSRDDCGWRNSGPFAQVHAPCRVLDVNPCR